MNVEESYDAAANAYAENLFSELDNKPLDRHLLNRFAEALADKGVVADLGCGPGQVVRYLHDRDLDVVGIDISTEMIRVAQRLTPDLEFRIGDIRNLDVPAGGLRGIVAFYSIVHFVPEELAAIMREWRRVLVPGGLVLLAFHIGNEAKHVDDLFGQSVSLDFQFHETRDVSHALGEAGFIVIETTEREPYTDVEYPSRRAYVLAKAV